jgi:signal transduction histidine kinase
MDGRARQLASRLYRRRASIAAALGVVMLAAIAAVASFALSFDEAKEFQDATLQQVAAMATSNTSAGPESRITVLRPSHDPLPPWLPPDLPAGFHTVSGPDGASLRVLVSDARSASAVIVMQDMEEINDVAVGSAFQTFIPALLLVLLVAWLAARAHATERRRVEGQRRFIANAAHELRSPLTALSIQIENVGTANTREDMQARLADLRGGIARARRVAEQMLTMARVQDAKPLVEPVDVAAVVREVIADAVELARYRSVDLGLDEHSKPRVRGSRESLRLIVSNAVDNAIRYGGRGASVTVRISHAGNEALVEIEDNGPGMPADLMPKAFEPFQRGNAGDQGAGLGLAIARDAAAKMGGSTTLRGGASGRGLVFAYRQRVVEDEPVRQESTA